MDPTHAIAALQERLKLQELISDVSAILEDLPPEEVDRQIEIALKRIVEFLGIDRSGFGEFLKEGLIVTHSYAVPGIEPPPHMILNDIFPWFAERLSNGQVVSMENPDNLPPEASKEKAYCYQAGLKSNLTIPFSIAGSMLCAVAFGSLRSYREWSDSIVKQLKRVGEIFAHAIYRKRAHQKIQNQLEFEKFISDLSAQFVNIAPKQVDQSIEESLEKLLIFFRLDRLALLKVSRDKKIATVTHSANAEGIPSAPLEINYVDHFPWHTIKILAQETVLLNMKDLPADAQQDRRSAEQLGIRSNLVIPLIVNGSVDYVLAANSVSEERVWETEVANRIRLLGEIFVHALIRRSAEEALSKSYEEIKLLKTRLEAEAEYLRSEIKVAYQYENIVGESKAIQQVLIQAEQVAATNSSVLILGETGTGKELIAHAIHNLSSRKNRAMVKVDCASLPSTLIEAELFGREKGAYTGAMTRQIGRFEVADGSTIFLDEVGELSLELQMKLLRVLQDGNFERLGSPRTIKVDVRVIAATNRNLAEAVRKGSFREDLYYRLSVFPITVPPLRERPKDIPLLVMAFLNEFRQKMGRVIENVPKQTMQALVRYQWPGNIRELRNVIEHSMIVSRGNVLQVQLPQSTSIPNGQRLTLHENEKQHITSVLESTNWVVKGPRGAAKVLGLKPSTLYGKMNRLGIAHAHNKTRSHT